MLLIEQQAWVPAYGEQDILGPVEIDPAARAAIEAVVASGVTVVQPAGNNVGGGLNLADLGLEGDSGALIVAAGGAPQHDDEGHRAGFSNYGERVDFHAQGEALVAAGYGDLTPDMPIERQYSACFGGTSGAAAIIAAAAAGVQGAAIDSGRGPLTPEQLRRRLAVGALSQHKPKDDGRIGPQPWIPAAADFQAPGRPGLLPPGPAGGGSQGVELRWTSDPDADGSTRLPDEVKVNGHRVGYVPAGHGRVTTSPGSGQHTWSVRSSDAAGNASESRGSFTVVGGTIVPTPDTDSVTPRTGGTTGGTEAEGGEAPPGNGGSEFGSGDQEANGVPSRPAATRVRSSWNRRKGRLVLRFTNLAPRAVVRVAGKRVKVRRGRAVVRRSRPGSLKVTIRARRRGSVSYRPMTFRVQVGKVRPAARGVRSSWNPNGGRLTLRFRKLAPNAVVRVAGKRVKVRRGRAVVRLARPGRVLVTVRAKARGAVSYRAMTFRVRAGTSPATSGGDTGAGGS